MSRGCWLGGFFCALRIKRDRLGSKFFHPRFKPVLCLRFGRRDLPGFGLGGNSDDLFNYVEV
jgi:hypothetical protein